jgi:hypothetical protein
VITSLTRSLTLAQVDGARRVLLETITRGARGDIVSVYTTFPWPALCAEMQKLKIELREGELVELPTTSLHPSSYTAVTGRKRAQALEISPDPIGSRTRRRDHIDMR